MNLPSLILKKHYSFVLHFLLQFLKVNSIPEDLFDIFDTNPLADVANLNDLAIDISIIV